MSGKRASVPVNKRLKTQRLVSCVNSNSAAGIQLSDGAQQTGAQRMDKDQCVVPVQFAHDGREVWMAGIAFAVACHELNAVVIEGALLGHEWCAVVGERMNGNAKIL